MNHSQTQIAVIGGGSWGTTLANLLAKRELPVRLWVYEADLAERMQKNRENDLYLPGISLDPKLSISHDLVATVDQVDVVLLVPPSQVLRSLLQQILPSLKPGALLIAASKGIENDSLMLMSDILETEVPAELNCQFAYLSGPSFAREVAQEMPTAVVAASKDLEQAERVQHLFTTDYFRVYTSTDPVGVELGGALKNVIALAAGISDGLGFGSNTRAGLITRGLAEMSRLGRRLGADSATFAGLAGMGDLVLTCTGDLSRNRTVGLELGRGRSLDEILSSMQMVAEGVKTTLSAYQLSQKLGVEMPFIEQAYLILYEGKDARKAVTDLMMRQPKPEMA